MHRGIAIRRHAHYSVPFIYPLVAAALHRVLVVQQAYLPAGPGAAPVAAWRHDQCLEFELVLLRIVAGKASPLQAPALRILMDLAALLSRVPAETGKQAAAKAAVKAAAGKFARHAIQLFERILKALIVDNHDHVR